MPDIHLLDPHFGVTVNPYDRDQPVMKELLEGKRLDPLTTQLSLMECYDIQYGLYDHLSEHSDPRALFHQHAAEDYITGSLLEIRLREILHKRLPELLNTPLMDILQYPNWMLDMLLSSPEAKPESLDDIQKKAAAEVDKLVKDMNRR